MQAEILQKQSPAATGPLEAATKPAVLQKLLVAYDFSSASETALRYAIEIGRAFGSEILLAHIETPQTLSDRIDGGLIKAKLEQLSERHDLTW